MNVDFPYHFNLGRTAVTVDDSQHIRNLIEQVLFTTPGERVNRPDFGTGLKQLIFAPNSDELTATVQMLVQGALQQYLSELIQVEGIEVESEEATLRISVSYTIKRTQQQQVAEFSQKG